MAPLINLLAVAGIAAVVLHMLRALASAALRSAQTMLADEAGDARARRGDLTGVEDARQAVGRARIERRRAFLLAAGWGIALLAPLLTPWTRTFYACYSALWLAGRLRPRNGSGSRDLRRTGD